MAWVARGKCKALGKKKSSTPAVVPGAAPALAKAGSADYVKNLNFFIVLMRGRRWTTRTSSSSTRQGIVSTEYPAESSAGTAPVG